MWILIYLIYSISCYPLWSTTISIPDHDDPQCHTDPNHTKHSVHLFCAQVITKYCWHFGGSEKVRGFTSFYHNHLHVLLTSRWKPITSGRYCNCRNQTGDGWNIRLLLNEWVITGGRNVRGSLTGSPDQGHPADCTMNKLHDKAGYQKHPKVLLEALLLFVFPLWKSARLKCARLRSRSFWNLYKGVSKKTVESSTWHTLLYDITSDQSTNSKP